MESKQDASQLRLHVVAAPDKFRGTASATAIAATVSEAASMVSASCDKAPMADGGEGTLDVLGGPTRSSVVTGPSGEPVVTPWRLSRGVAVIEMALASGLEVAGGVSNNDTMGATTAGTGELIAEAVDAGAHRVVVAVGGSATTDGGSGALQALPPVARMHDVEVVVACDVRTKFLDAARVFGPQKGASVEEVELLSERLSRLASVYMRDYGVDVTSVAGTGAAGGLAGGLLARGAKLVEGFEVIADEIDLRRRVAKADVLVTGEGSFDSTSLEGKVVGGVARLAAESAVPTVAVVGGSDPEIELPDGLTVIDLSERFGSSKAMADVRECVRMVTVEMLAALARSESEEL